ncbi:MAG: hypothetical protein ABI460_09505 [Caldimonas sp.]
MVNIGAFQRIDDAGAAAINAIATVSALVVLKPMRLRQTQADAAR